MRKNEEEEEEGGEDDEEEEFGKLSLGTSRIKKPIPIIERLE